MRATTRTGSELLADGLPKASGKVEISRFKGLGEMPPRSCKETTMDPATAHAAARDPAAQGREALQQRSSWSRA